jgi:signal transduction histidine kinase
MDLRNTLQQFEELVTAFRRNVIESARIRLTAYYVLVLTITVIAVDAIVNYSRTWSAERRLVDLIPNAQMFQDVSYTIQQTVTDIRSIDFAIYGVLIAAFGFVSYKIAGRNMAPINAVIASQRRFLANAAHELRTPLSIIKSDIEVRLGNPAAPSQEELKSELLSITEEVNRMSETINNLLLIANAYHNKKPAFSKVDVTTILTNCYEIVLPAAAHAGVIVKIAKDLPLVHVDGNVIALEQIFTNVLRNAVKYTPRGGTVRIGLTLTKRSVHIRINDTGVGIPTGALARVFEPFFRVQNISEKEGSGLGLTLVKELVELHKGSITLESIEGKGTTAVISLPRAS